MTSPLTNQNALIAMVRDDIPVEIVEDIQERSSATQADLRLKPLEEFSEESGPEEKNKAVLGVVNVSECLTSQLDPNSVRQLDVN